MSSSSPNMETAVLMHNVQRIVSVSLGTIFCFWELLLFFLMKTLIIKLLITVISDYSLTIKSCVDAHICNMASLSKSKISTFACHAYYYALADMSTPQISVIVCKIYIYMVFNKTNLACQVLLIRLYLYPIFRRMKDWKKSYMRKVQEWKHRMKKLPNC